MDNPSGQLSAVIATRLTAPGRGAVASIHLSCVSPDQASTIDAAFSSASGLAASSAPLNRVLFGAWRGEDVVVVRTAETEWEVHCHGGDAAVTRILEEFHVAAPAAPESGIEELLLQTRTTRTAQLVLAQAAGVLREALLQAAAAESKEEFRQCLEDLLQWNSLVAHLVEPWRVVIAGPPNVGKSSLMNALAGFERAIVYDQPGTTRDAVHTELVLAGWPFCLVDTAGIRQQTDDPVESLGIAHAQELLNTADLILIAVDATVGWNDEQQAIVDRLPPRIPVGVVCCKCDLSRCDDLPHHEWPVFRTSAEQETGLQEVTDWIVHCLIPHVPEIDTPLPVAGSGSICSRLIRQLNAGQSLTQLQRDLLGWLHTQPWSATAGDAQTQ